MNNSTFKFFFFFLQVNTSLRKDPCGKSTHDSHLWFTIINAEPLIQHPLSPCRIYSSLYITDKVSYDTIKWPLDFNQIHVVWRIWSLNKARKTITQLRCKTKQRLKWTPKETFLWDYVKLQTAPCLHNWHYWITADTWQSRQGLRHCQQVTLFMRRIWPVPTKKQKEKNKIPPMWS